MKKIMIILIVLLLLPMAAMAVDANNGQAGTPLELTGLTISTSPGVFAFYRNSGNGTPQWYLIATAHGGGTKFYATAQNATSIFKLDDATAPITLAELTALQFPTQDQAASEDYWSNSDSWYR